MRVPILWFFRAPEKFDHLVLMVGASDRVRATKVDELGNDATLENSSIRTSSEKSPATPQDQTSKLPKLQQNQAPIQIEQHSQAPNSPNTAVVGNNNQVNINPDPKAPVITYMYDGDQRISRPGLITDNPENPAAKAFKKIGAAHTGHDWRSLNSLCDAAIKETPEWLTPQLYKAEAYANLGRYEEAVQLLNEVKKNATANQDYDRLITEANELLQKLHDAGH